MKDESEKSVARVGKSLRSYGIPRSRVRELLDDLRLEVKAAVESGGKASSILGVDPCRFAAELAVAEGYRPVPSRFFGLSLAVALPPLLIAFIVYVVIAGGGPNLGLPEMRVSMAQTSTNREFLEGVNEGWFIAATYGVAAILGFSLTLSAGAAYLAIRKDACLGGTIRNMAILLPIGALFGVLAAMFVGAATRYSTDGSVIAIECSVVALGSLAALWVARSLARGRPFAAGFGGR